MRSAKLSGILAAATVFMGVDIAQSAVLQWDADGVAGNGANGGSGNWNTQTGNKVWFDGSSDIAWTTGNEAIFGGTAGSVTVSGSNPLSLTVNTDGYVFNQNLSVGPTTTPAAATDYVFINGNVQFNGQLNPGTRVGITIAPGKTLTLSNGGSPRRINGGAVSVTGGALNIGQLVLNSAVTQTGGAASSSFSTQSPVIGSAGTGSWTLNNAAASVSIGGGGALLIGETVFNQGAGNGTLTINAGAVYVPDGASLRIGVANGTGVVNVAGGEMAVTGIGSTVYILDGGSGSGTLRVSSGTATIETIQFGRTASPSGTGTLTVSGGSLYVGAGGILPGTAASSKAIINFSGGTLGAAADWSSSMAITLSGATTIRAANASDSARNISLSGNVGGTGSLTKTGAGKLTLGSATYSGATQVTAGILEVNGTIATSSLTVSESAALHGTGSVINDVVIDGTAAPAGSSIGKLKVGSAIFGDGSTLQINLGVAGQSDTLAVTGALDITDATLSLSGAADFSTYVIATYGGKLTGDFATAPVLPDGYEINFGTRQNSSITLVAMPEPAMGLLLPGVAMALSRRSRRKR